MKGLTPDMKHSDSFRYTLYICILALLFAACLSACASSRVSPAEESAASSSPESLPETEEASFSTASAETEPLPPETTAETTTEPETEPPDPALDVLNHYSNMFIASNVNTYLNVRNAPSTSGSIIGKLVKDAGGEILEDLGNGWYHILSGGIDGFIAADYCITGEEAALLAPSVAHPMVRVTAERLNVRTGPGTEYEVWTQLGTSETQAVEEKLDGWYKIIINNTDGYISSDFAEEGWYLTEAMPWSSISAASPTRQQLFAYAEQFIGIPYAYGGTSLAGGGIDCSSFVQQCLRNAIGISIDRTSGQQAYRGYDVSLADAKPGDLMFYCDRYGTIDHVAFYMGDGKILHAARSIGCVSVSAYNYAAEPILIKNVIGE